MNVRKMKNRYKIPRWQKISSGVLFVIAFFFLVMPVYIREALIHWYPDITDTYLFESHVVSKSHTCWDWPVAAGCNSFRLDKADSLYLDEYGTVAFLVIQNDSILFEEYRDSWTPLTLSNLFSATKSIVGLLIGVAHDEGYIKSLDDKVSVYLPAFKEGKKAEITVRNLLTMSSGLQWDEAYSSLFSKTTQAYYGDNIRDLVMNLDVAEEPGKRYSYKSGDTQLLSLLLEAATGQTISDYAQDKLWKPMQACTDALWNLDRKGGDEKSYCCFNTTARDAARFARLILREGDWNGRQLVSPEYMREAISPAVYLENEFGDGALNYYGFQIWIMHYKGVQFPAFRGLGGQYIFAIPQKNAIVVRLGHKRSNVYEREITVDIPHYLDIAFQILK